MFLSLWDEKLVRLFGLQFLKDKENGSWYAECKKKNTVSKILPVSVCEKTEERAFFIAPVEVLCV